MVPSHSQQGHFKKHSRVFAESVGEEIVISGMAGRFPNSRNVSELEYGLYNKIDMTDDTETRWRRISSDMPVKSGKIKDLEKFDADFFGVPHEQVNTMDPQGRILLEVAYEAVLDAGINPIDLRGSRTGVYIGITLLESEKAMLYESTSSSGFAVYGCSRAMLANRISFAMDFIGPSLTVDTACSSSMCALDCAFSAMRAGEIDAALVGGSQLTLHPKVTLEFAKIGILSPDGYCRPLDNDARGYARAEAVTCIFLQRRRDCNRVYCTFVYSKTNSDGFKPEGITYPSRIMQEQLLKEFYNDLGLSPQSIGFMEAHLTGTEVGDPEECAAIDSVLCNGRTDPLLIGSVKSNIGHTEASSGISAVIKSIFAFQSGKIAPNIHFKSPRKDIPALMEGRLKVVTQPEPLKSLYIAVNSFGFGGSNAHILLQGDPKCKQNKLPEDDMPRLVLWSSRTVEGTNVFFDAISSKPLDTGFVALLHNIQKLETPGFTARGFGLFSQSPCQNASCIAREVKSYKGKQRPIVWIFSGIGSQWAEMGASLMKIPLFKESIQQCHDLLKPKGIDLIGILTSSESDVFENSQRSIIGIVAVQIAIVNVLRAVELEPEYIVGNSIGKIACAYADGALTAEQAMLAAFYFGEVISDTEMIIGNRSIPKIPRHLDKEYSKGAGYIVSEFNEDFGTESRKKETVANKLLKHLKEFIPGPKKRSSKWISPALLCDGWCQSESELCSAEYNSNSLLNSVFCEEAFSLLPSEAITVEIAPHGLLQTILKNSMPNAIHVPLTHRLHHKNVNFFLCALGKLFLNGAHLSVERLYSKIDFPVSRGTPPISPFIRWEHSLNWYVPKFEEVFPEKSGQRTYQIDLGSDKDSFLAYRKIDGKVLIPESYFLQAVWETYSLMNDGNAYADMPVAFGEVRFIRTTQLTIGENMTITVLIHHASGNFEISQAGSTVVTGHIAKITDPLPPKQVQNRSSEDIVLLESHDFYKELRLRGHHYAGLFKGVMQARSDGLGGTVQWLDNWIAFMDALLQISIIQKDSRSTVRPSSIQHLRIFGRHHLDQAGIIGSDDKLFEFNIDPHLHRMVAGGIEMLGLHTVPCAREKPIRKAVLETYEFAPLLPAPKTDMREAVRTCVQIAFETHLTAFLKIVEVDLDDTPPAIQHFQEAISELPIVSGDFTLLSSKQQELPGILVEDCSVRKHENCMLLVSTNLLGRPKWVATAQRSISEKGYLVSVETHYSDCTRGTPPQGFNIVAIIPFDEGSVLLLQRTQKETMSPTVVQVSQYDVSYAWLDAAQSAITTSPVILVAENEPTNGLIGMVNCLRREPDSLAVTCVFIDDPHAPPFDLHHKFYADKLKLGLPINVFRAGKWGTYLHLKLKPGALAGQKNTHCYVDVLQPGDLSSLAWLQGEKSAKDCQIKVAYAALNSQDAMLATGRITHEAPRLEDACKLGLEFSGIGKDGERYMGVKASKTLATHVDDVNLIWPIPDTWTLEEAASVPYAYLMVFKAFYQVCNIQTRRSILIHFGADGVGQAAISVAIANDLEVFTTVGTQKERRYLLERFRQLKESHIGNSKDTSFENMIAEQTLGRGVDIVLNSLSKDTILASVRCLARNGQLIGIGVANMHSEHQISLAAFRRGISIHGISADKLFEGQNNKVLVQLISNGIRDGIIKPLPTTIFEASEVEPAFRLMAQGDYIGKVLIRVHNFGAVAPISYFPRTYFDPNLVYIVLGGLGGFGLEFTDWMILRHARKVVLGSRKGISKAYQLYRIKLWRSYGVKIEVRTDDITTHQGCRSLIDSAMNLGQVGGIFNLAVLLRDATFANQNPEAFRECLAPKALATQILDNLSRELCPKLEHFVIFSSVSSGRGNAGQTTYGMANSVMERIIEKRADSGLVAKAIQWGTIGTVGLVAESEFCNDDTEVGGTQQQKISSCLEELDKLLVANVPIVSSMVVAEKKSMQSSNVMETVANHMGIRDINSISMTLSLTEVGMDSLMNLEIKNVLENKFQIFVSSQTLRSMTFQKLKELSDLRLRAGGEIKLQPPQSEQSNSMAWLFEDLGIESSSHQEILPLRPNVSGFNPTLIIPGMQGVANKTWFKIAHELNNSACMLQLTNTKNCCSIHEVTDSILANAKEVLKSNQPFYLVGYSFGVLVSLELAYRLEQEGFQGHVTLIDGSPLFAKELTDLNLKETPTDEGLQNLLLLAACYHLLAKETYEDFKTSILEHLDFNSKLNHLLDLSDKQTIYSKQFIGQIIQGIYNRTKLIEEYSLSSVKPISSPITLIRSKDLVVPNMPEDYGLRKHTTGKVVVKSINGDHTTVLINPSLPHILNRFDPNNGRDKF